MLSKEDNELMCRVGPGTAMGVAMRRYWLPALLCADLGGPDSDPVRVELLGESFVAFRDSQGRVGVLDEACRHRSASLALGRVEGDGIRCIYHGWKFAVDGRVMETPNVADESYRQRFAARAYSVREAAGMVWVYLGPPELEPPFPAWKFLSLPPAHRLNTRHRVDCNYVQIIEGLVDSSHLGVLHMDGLRKTGDSDLAYAKSINSMQFNLAPLMEVEDTPFGFHYAALRAGSGAGAGKTEARVAAFIAPCGLLNPNGDIATFIVPMDDERSHFFHLFWDIERKIGEEPLRGEQLRFVGLDPEALDAYGLAPGAAADRPSAENNYHQDRGAMKRGASFSGLPGLIQEDVAVSVSAGAIRDRSREMLSPADLGVVRLYRTLLACARSGQRGEDPLGVRVRAENVRGANGVLAPGERWQSLTAEPNPAKELA